MKANFLSTGNFSLPNQVRILGREERARQGYARLAGHKDGDKAAGACKQCGACLPKCPNKVPIMERLKDVAATLSDPREGQKG